MTSVCPYENETEERLHRHAIQRLAEDLGMPREDIRPLYEEILSGIRQEARFRNYLVILVCRRVKNLIQSRSLTTELTKPRRYLALGDTHAADTVDSAKMPPSSIAA